VTVIEIALALRSEATRHKRLSSQHRRAAHDRMEQLRAFCAANHIATQEITRRSGDERHGSPEADKRAPAS
jgi:hypothetical protein